VLGGGQVTEADVVHERIKRMLPLTWAQAYIRHRLGAMSDAVWEGYRREWCVRWGAANENDKRFANRPADGSWVRHRTGRERRT
jgi:hypothetical protein